MDKVHDPFDYGIQDFRYPNPAGDYGQHGSLDSGYPKDKAGDDDAHRSRQVDPGVVFADQQLAEAGKSKLKLFRRL